MYLIFSGEDYYPNGGMSDFKTSKQTPFEVVDYIHDRFNDNSNDYFIHVAFCDGISVGWICFIFMRQQTVWVNYNDEQYDYFSREEQPFDEWADDWLNKIKSS